MTRETAQKLLKNADLMAVYAAGGHIQENMLGEWRDIDAPSFDRPPKAYRIKPREPREFWVSDHDNGKYRYTYDEEPDPKHFDKRQNVELFKVREILTDETP